MPLSVHLSLSLSSRPSLVPILKHPQAFYFSHPERVPLSAKKRKRLGLQLCSLVLAQVLHYSSICCRKNCPNRVKGRAAPGTTTPRASMNNMPMSVMSQESLATMMPSQHPASSLTYCFRRTPDQGLAPMPQGLDQGSLEAHWGLDLAPMEPLLHTLAAATAVNTLPATIHRTRHAKLVRVRRPWQSTNTPSRISRKTPCGA